MEKIEKLKKTCRLIEIDIHEIISEIVELQITRETLTEELKEARKALYKEIAKTEHNNDKAKTI